MNITKGKQQRCQRVVLYGQEGVGKTTFASCFPSPVFIDVEAGSATLDVARTDTPTSFRMLLTQIAELTKDHQGFKTAVIESADWVQRLAVTQMCAEHNQPGIEGFGYGKGYTFLAEMFGQLLDALSGLAESGMHVVLTAHSAMKKMELPEEEGAFDRYELKLEKKVAPLVKEWSDMLLFACFKTIVITDDKTQKTKAHGARRIIRTEHGATWDAKNRVGLPSEIPLEWASLAPHFEAPAPAPAPAPEPTAALAAPADPAPEPTVGAVAELRDMMAVSGVTEQELMQTIADRGYYPSGTPMDKIDERFIRGKLLRNWDSVVKLTKNGSMPNAK